MLLQLQVNNGIASLTLNRPEVKNAFNAELIAELHAHLKVIGKNPLIKVVVIKGAGDCFSAGADLNWMRDSVKLSKSANRTDALKLAQMLQELYFLKKPTIACVHGAAFGGALGIIACCDLAIASDNAKFCLSEVKLGLSPAVISPYVLQAIGPRAARRFMLTAEIFDAKQAVKIGLIHIVVAKAELAAVVDNAATTILQNSPQAMAVTKQLIQTNHPIDNKINDYTAKIIAELRASAEGQEGIAAFLAKRPPSWCE